jgi:hypothetical protein
VTFAWFQTTLRSRTITRRTRLIFFSYKPRRASENLTLMMALPSSPPRFSSEEPPSSPLLPTLGDVPFTANAGRKRLHSDYGSLSSDPLFSEDSSELDFQDEGEQPKRKRLVKGPWWDVGRRPRQSLRRNMMKKERFRNVDSGVWMGSDGSDESLPMEPPRMSWRFAMRAAGCKNSAQKRATIPQPLPTGLCRDVWKTAERRSTSQELA